VHATDAASDVGDEPLLLALRTGVPVWVGRDRVAAARALRAAHPAIDVILSDDGAQHLALARDIEVLVFDDRGAGNGWLLPAGPLREPLVVASTAAHTLVLYSGSAASTALDGSVSSRRLHGVVGLDAWWAGQPATSQAMAALVERATPATVCAVAGIAQPQRFFDLLAAAGVRAGTLALADHERYDRLPWPAAARELVVTEKDAVKLRPERIALECPGLKIWVAPLDFQPQAGFWSRLDAALDAVAASS
jgi:tetraacyldisaccharide 4'-kinase